MKILTRKNAYQQRTKNKLQGFNYFLINKHDRFTACNTYAAKQEKKDENIQKWTLGIRGMLWCRIILISFYFYTIDTQVLISSFDHNLFLRQRNRHFHRVSRTVSFSHLYYFRTVSLHWVSWQLSSSNFHEKKQVSDNAVICYPPSSRAVIWTGLWNSLCFIYFVCRRELLENLTF